MDLLQVDLMDFKVEELSGRSALRDWRCDGRQAAKRATKELSIGRTSTAA